MADVRISDLPSTDLVGRQDIVPIVQVGSTKRVTVSGFLIQSENDLRAYADQAEVDAIATASGYTVTKFNEAIATASGYTNVKFNEAVATASGYAVNARTVAIATASGYAVDSLNTANAYTNAQVDPLNDFRIWDATRTYGTNEPTFRNGIPYRSLISGNINNDPATNPDKWEVVGGGGSGGIENFIKNDLTKNNLIGVSGNGQTSLIWDTTASGVLTAGAARVIFPSSGTGRYLDIELNAVNPNDIGQPWYVKFSYILGTNADDLVSVVLFDGTNEIPTAIGLLPYAGGTLQVTGGAVLPNNVLTGNKLRFKFKDNTAITFYVADVSVGPPNVLAGAAVGATQTYPLTIGATTTPPTKGTVVEDIATWARHGDKMVWSYRYRQTGAGSNGSGTYLFPLPVGHSIDLAKHLVGSVVGVARVSNNPNGLQASTTTGFALVHSATQLYIIISTATASTYAPVSSDNFRLGTDVNIIYDISATLTIAQWTSNVNLASDFQEFAYNTQAAINTNDTTSFGYGSGGTPILANTAVTFYDVAFQKPFQATDKYSIELRSKVDGAWVDIAEASVPSLYIPGFAGIAYTNSTNNMFLRNITLARVAANKIRVLFGDGINGGTSSWSGTPVVGRGWAQIVAAADGYDRWRVRKISNGNMAEVPNLVHARYTGHNSTTQGNRVIFGTKVEDTHSGYNIATGVYTIPITGLYIVEGDFLKDGTQGNISLRVNSSNWKAITLFASLRQGLTATRRYNAGDTIDFVPDTGGLTANAVTNFSITRIGN